MDKMDKYPVLLDDRPVGELSVIPEGLYIRFSARCPLPEEGLWRAWAVGERGELCLGVLEPEGRQGAVCRRFSRQSAAPAGRILRGEVRTARDAENWTPVPVPDQLFRAPWLRQRLKETQGALTRRAGELRYLALPYDKRRPFPMATLFCFARLREIGTGIYVVYAFDKDERPVFQS